MSWSFRKIYPFYFLVDFILINLSFYISYFWKYNSFETFRYGVNLSNFKEYSFIFMLWFILIIISFKRRNLYSTDRNITIPQEFFKVIVGVVFSSVFMGAVIFFTQYKFFSRFVFFVSFILLCLFLSVWRILKRLVLRRLISGGFHNVNVLIIGAGKVGRAVAGEAKKVPWLGLKIIGLLDDNVKEEMDNMPVLGAIKDFFVITKKYFIDEVIITIPSERKAVSDIIQEAKEMRLGLKIVPEKFEESLPVLDVNHLGLIPLLTYKERKYHPAEFALKRFFDFVISAGLLLFLLPLFIIVAFLIKLEFPGSVFYVQKRMGYKGRIFNFYKFRSMVKDADKLKPYLLRKNEVRDGVIFKIKKDPRITRVGHFLRKYSLDELPQIFNVLRGDMSLIGPRPFPVDESRKFEYNHMPRLSIRPGITGLAQVRGRSDLSFYQWVKWDLWYIHNWSFGLDLRILLWTVPVVLKGKGAY